MAQSLPLLIIFLIGVLTKNNLLAAASAIVMVMGLLNLERFLPMVERRGIEVGLLFLTMSVLAPFASGKVTLQSLAPPRNSLRPLCCARRHARLLPQRPGVGYGERPAGSCPRNPRWRDAGRLVSGGIPVGPIMCSITAVLAALLQWKS